MFKCIHVQEFDFEGHYFSIDEINKYKKKYDKIMINIEKFLLNKDGVFDVDKINNELFADIKPDIFISHAHIDEEQVIKLAAKIEFHTGLKVFVDSCVWANAYELLRKIDDEYCYKKESNTYEYEYRNHTTSNVFMILNAALHRVINSSEVLIFLGTDNSININDLFTSKKYISSPWIFSELQFANLVKRVPPLRYLGVGLEGINDSRLAEDSSIKKAQFAYPTPDSDFTVTNQQLITWAISLAFEKESHPLDLLYTFEKLKK